MGLRPPCAATLCVTSVMWISSLLSQASAASREDVCAPLEEPELRALVLDAQSSIDRGDIELPSNILGEVRERLECLAFAPEPRMWADLMVASAIVEFSRGGDWQSPMAAALRIRPAIDRGVGLGHPLAHWVAPPTPAAGAPVPSGVRLYVDGAPSPVLPPDDGLFLVQKTDGRYWNTLFIYNEPVPMSWVEAPVEQPPRIAAWGRLGFAGGTSSAQQLPSWLSDVYPNKKSRDPAASAHGDLMVTFFSPFGVQTHAMLTLWPTFDTDGWVSAIWARRGLSIGGGPGIASFHIVDLAEEEPLSTQKEPTEVVRSSRLPYLQGHTMLRSGEKSRWDILLSVGAGPAVNHYEFGVGMLLPEINGERYRLGFLMDARSGHFIEQGVSQRSLRVSSSLLLLRIDWVRGEY